MKEEKNRQEPQEAQPSSHEGKRAWQKPRLTFVKPTLTKHGKLDEVTGQFFGAFTPPPTPG